jgi:hypothetical protein
MQNTVDMFALLVRAFEYSRTVDCSWMLIYECRCGTSEPHGSFIPLPKEDQAVVLCNQSVHDNLVGHCMLWDFRLSDSDDLSSWELWHEVGGKWDGPTEVFVKEV